MTVTGGGRIRTRGDGAIGIVAQSVGGGGGAGGASLGLGLALVATGGSVTIGLGGTGGIGGVGGAVTLNRTGTVTTGLADDGTGHASGHGAHGVLAQSIGGGGGTGGWVGALAGVGGTGVAISTTLGGDGGSGGLGGAVSITQLGAIRTFGDGAHGVLVQSVGGGGGDGGMALGIGGAGKGGAITTTLGGDGVAGGNAGAASAILRGAITTAGDLSSAVVVQSIGGGGGNGGVAAGLGFAGSGAALTTTLGGGGGGGGNAGTTTVSASSAINTAGALSHGLLAQSIGGGGGSGGIAVGASVMNDGMAVQVTLGGSGGTAGAGAAVAVSQSGGMATRGDGAYGILAQSIGGGGGDGGMAIGIAATASNNATLGATLGGRGGAGGAAGVVTVGSSGLLSTQGMLAMGVVAQSIGGGGGNGGMALSGGLSMGGTQASITLGGAGNGGGAGGAVSLTRRMNAAVALPNGSTARPLSAYALPAGNRATLSTAGGGAHAVLAQSIGGGGGNGGMAGSVLLGIGKDAANFAVTVGGAGDVGAAGGRVSVVVVDRILTGGVLPTTDQGAITAETLGWLREAGLSTEGGAARGVVAQSIGGGGGDGGGAVAIGLNSGEGKRNVTLALGGSGAGGGAGGIATAIVVGAVQTSGANSDAVLVQSIGGGGGSGGFAVAGSLGTGAGTTITVALGGGAGAGNGAALARATFQGNIVTTGDGARGVVAQSIGGGGGIGGLSFAGTFNTSAEGGGKMATLSIGGGGGAGGTAGAAEVRTLAVPGERGSISTAGRDAHAIVAQSIGGGGGMGGLAIAALMSRLGTEEALNATVTVGGSGGTGGTGGRVTVSNLSDLVTTGANAMGILAQSVGGGGGIGGGAISAVLRVGVPEKRQVAMTVAVGGLGGDGNLGGNVDVSNAGRITTSGDGAHGIFAQSIGGGGGAGGASNAISLALGQKPEVAPGATSPDKMNWQFTVAVGGNGGTAGHARGVTATNREAIATAGFAAHGMLLQSIGGGGGSGGDGRAGMTGLVPPRYSRALDMYVLANGLDRASFTRNFKVGVGGTGGASGNGGTVLANNGAAINTTGDWSQAIFAQSIGGGGGTGGMGLAGALGKLAIGGEGIGGGHGGTVSVTNLAGATLQTTGEHANALVAQSVGGGGGAGGGGGGIIVIGRSGGGGGDGGTVSVDNAATIRTRGGFSSAILAQSIGGGGGLGGASGLGDEPEPGTRIIAIGADSGSNGNGGTVRVAHTGAIVTQGIGSWGIAAQSVGGGGGVAQFEAPPIPQLAPPSATPPPMPDSTDPAILAVWREQMEEWRAAGLAFGRQVLDEVVRVTKRPLISFGADGASGGAGGLAEVTVAGSIATSGAGAHGILAQSIGGGGGAGTGTGVFDFGSSGGASGNGGEARVVLNGGTVLTTGAGAFGVLAQSIGGGGGAAYADIRFNGVLGFDPNVLTVRTGATTGASGHGGTATIRLTAGAAVETRAPGGFGLVAQSIGGGGGASLGEISSSGHAILGGDGAAGAGGAALIDLADAAVGVLTRGGIAPALLAQSIAGGGGILAPALGGTGIGASGATTGNAGRAEIRLVGLVRTLGIDSTGAQVQSIAGGGGYGLGAGGAVSLGAQGVASGMAGEAVLRASGTVETAGRRSIGLLAQSIGSGGGYAIGTDSTETAQLGNRRDAGGAGGAVTLAAGTVTSTGFAAPAIIAQSIAGGGGVLARTGGLVRLGFAGAEGPVDGATVPVVPDGSGAAAAAGAVTIESLGAITAGRGLGVLAQSVAGGGGVVLEAGGGALLGGGGAGVIGTRLIGDDVRVFIGGNGGVGGAVTVSASAADILSQGAGLLAQSIGGGGGLVARAAGAVTLGAGIGTGGTVGLTLGGMIETTGGGAPALVAQSIGGGGGAVLYGATAATLGGGRGDGGGVTITTGAALATAGSASHGIVAQSIGGGGGYVAPINGAVTLLAGTGSGGAVRIDNSGDITVAGSNAHGIVAQSLGGGGGLVGGGTPVAGAGGIGTSGVAAGGLGIGGAIAITNTARIAANGAAGIGILAESLGAQAGTAPITVTLGAGSVVLGGVGGTGVVLRGGVQTLTNDGVLGTINGPNGRALFAEGLGASVVNRGTITGSIDSSGGAVAFDNRRGALFNTGARVALGTGTLDNAGGLAVLGRGRIGTTALAGNFAQSATGTNYVDVGDRAGTMVADRLNITGTARLAGTVAAELIPGTALPPGTQRATILSAAGGTVLSAGPLTLSTPSTLNASWSLQYPNPSDVVLAVTLTTTAPAAAMSSNQRSVAKALNSAATSNPTGFATYSGGVYGANNAASYSASMTSLGGEGGAVSLLAAQGAASQFMMGITARLDQLQRSGDAGLPAPASFAPFALATAFGEEGATLSGDALLGMNSLADTLPSPTRFWAMPLGYGGRADTQAAFGSGAEARVGGFMTGFDHQVAPNLLIGAAGGYSSGTYDAGQTLSRGQLEGGHMGFYGMWRSGPLYLSGTLGYARHEAKQSRVIGLEGQSEYARSIGGMHNANAALEFGARFDMGGFALSPFAGIGLNAWRQDGARETSTAADGSGGVLGLTQQARADTSVPTSLGIRWDSRFAGPDGLMITPYIRAAWVHETRTSLTSTASFALAPDQSFNIVTPRTARDRLAMNLGMQMQPSERLGFGFGVIGEFGEGTQSIGGFGRVVVRW